MISILKIAKLKIKNSHMRGFTLMELVVAVGLFSAIAVIAVGALFQAQSINAKMQQTHIMLDGMNLSMEAITRDIRYGRQFHCYNLSDLLYDIDIEITNYHLRENCPRNPGPLNTSGGNALVLGQNGANKDTKDRIVYYLYNGHIMKWEGDDVYGTSTPVTSNDVEIQMLKFFVNGAESLDQFQNLSGAVEATAEQPTVTVIIVGVTKPVKASVQPVYFKIQTTATAREIDY